jgi:ABC-type lipoprotein release transport system permease subunit
MRYFIEKQRHILDFTLSSLLRRRGKNFALIAVYTLVVFSLGSVMFFTQAIKHEAGLVLKETPEIIVQRLVAGRQELIPLDYVQKIKQIRGIAAVKERLWGYYFDPVNNANYTIMCGPLGEKEVVIGQGVSDLLNAPRGSVISLRDQQGYYKHFDVSGTFDHDSALISSDLILMSEYNFRKLFGFPAGLVTDLLVTVRNKKEIPTIARKIFQLLPDTRSILRDGILSTYDAAFDWRGGIILVILAGAVLAFLIFAWDKAAGLSAEEKKEIGILKAIGWETGDVLQMKFWEGLAVSLCSFLMGILLAYGHIFLSSASLFKPALMGWSTLYPSFRLVPFIDAYQVAILFFFTVLPYTVATIIPSWRAATTDPDLVMRG